MKNAFDVVADFEKALSEYTGAPYVVAVDSCTNALFLCLKFEGIEGKRITIPKRTYLSVPQSIIHAGGEVVFCDFDWSKEGIYNLGGTKTWDSAKVLTSGMYKVAGQNLCLSFHTKKLLNIGKGGAILTDNKELSEWAIRARYEGRNGGIDYRKDDLEFLGWNMYMTPEQAARGMALLQVLPKHNEPQVEDPPYRDLTEFTIFKNCEILKYGGEK